MSGFIEEIPLPDLLQMLATSRKGGLLTVTSDDGVGKIYLRRGHVYFATLDDDFAVGPQKAIYRMLRWTSGAFELALGMKITVMEEIEASTEALLTAGARLGDAFRQIEPQLPPRDARLALTAQRPAEQHEFALAEADVYELVRSRGTLQAVLDHYPGSDFEAAQAVISLLRRGFVRVEDLAGV